MSQASAGLPDLAEWGEDFAKFHERFADLFGRSEPRELVQRYLRGLLGGVERRNGWQLAEAMGEEGPRPTQRLLDKTKWSAAAARDRLQDFCIEQFGDPEGIAILDETGFLKKGTHSAGVARQYTGTAGKTENCQIGVFLGYASRHGHALVDRGLYLPREWTNDAPRCRSAKVPSQLRFRTKPTLGRRMIARAKRRGLAMRWITGDEVYGNDPKLRDWIDGRKLGFVLAVACTTQVWSEKPVVTPPPPRAPGSRGRARTRPTVTPAPRPVVAIVADLPGAAWTRFAAFQGEKGPIEYDWTALRVVEKRGPMPGAERWLLARRSVSDPTEVAYYLSNASEDTPLATLARVAATRFTIEQCLLEAKDDVGMDQYEVRGWPGWYRFVTLCLMAVAWVASVRRQLQARAESTLPDPSPAAKKGGPRLPFRPHHGASRRSDASS